jgi:transposase
MKLLKFSRKFWQAAVEYKGSEPTVLRDYDVLEMVKAGKSYTQIAIRHQISKDTIIRIVKKYR